MSVQSEPAWLTVGGPVAMRDHARSKATPTVTITTIEKISATEVRAGGQRFHRGGAQLGIGDARYARLLPVTDPHVQDWLAAQLVMDLREALDHALALPPHADRHGVDSVATALDDARALVEGAVHRLAQINAGIVRP